MAETDTSAQRRVTASEKSPRAVHHETGRRNCYGVTPAAGKIPVLLVTERGRKAEGERLVKAERRLDTREEAGEREEG